ncbi:hypothetical protein CSUI_000693 [Cystoisospora suis]|uniref:Mic1 domain-containing protein n=1 Tax=Cystoisospora suis TaxID=483139 RepID=A0A2C6L015_9APIC|nr:hypothetical protein CSUI_000693 [Cystoisospora suis]
MPCCSRHWASMLDTQSNVGFRKQFNMATPSVSCGSPSSGDSPSRVSSSGCASPVVNCSSASDEGGFSSSSCTGIGHLEYSAHRPPPPLTEAELRYYAALPTISLSSAIFSWSPSHRNSSATVQQRVLFDEVHYRVLHQKISTPQHSPGIGTLPLDRRASFEVPGALRQTARSFSEYPNIGASSRSIVCCTDTPPHKLPGAESTKQKRSFPPPPSFCLPFDKPLASILRFSPCGRYLLYVVAAPPASSSLSPSSGQSSAAAGHCPPSSGGTETSQPGAAGGGTGGPSDNAATGTASQTVEVGIMDASKDPGEDGAITLIPLSHTGGGSETETVLQAFWLPSLSLSETEANICVITQQAVEIFTFVFSPPSVRRSRRLPQPCSLAWALLCPYSVSPPPWPPSASTCPSVNSQQSTGNTESPGACRAPGSSSFTRPAVAGAFVLAVAARTLQPFLLKWNDGGKSGVTLTRLPKIELNLPQWHSLQQQEVHFLLVYGVVYCIHVDEAAGRISMRTLTGPPQPDVVLDCLQPGSMEVSVVDNLILVHHHRLHSTLIYDIYDYPPLPTVPFSVSSPVLSLPPPAAPCTKATVRAVTPLVHPGIVGSAPTVPFDEVEGLRTFENGHGSKADNSQQLDDVELQTVDFDSARFVGGAYMMDEEGGHMYLLVLNQDVLMHRLLLERQSLSFALQVMQQRAGCRRQVLRLLQHALRLQTPLQDLFPVLQLVNQRYRAAVESIPDQLLCRPGSSSPQLPSPNKHSARQLAASEETCSGSGKPRSVAGGTGGDGGQRGIAVGGSSAKGKARVALEQLVATVGDGTVLTERDVVLSVLYPYVVEVLNLHPGQLLLDAAFGVELNSPSSFALRSFPGAVDETSCLDPIVSPPLGCHCEGGVCGAITRSQRTQALLDPWAPGRIGSDAEGGKGPAEEDMIVGGAIPYVLSVALEYMRSLLSHQVLPHRVLQTFIFDVCVFFRRGDILRQLMQYHVLLDSPDMLQRLCLIWQHLRLRAGVCAYCARDERWTQQACLDMALRHRDWSAIVSILIQLKEYTRVVPLLRRYGVSSYPLKAFLRSVAADVKAQEAQPGLLQHILACIRAWANEASLSSYLAPPNLAECALWLPRALGPAGAPKQLPSVQAQHSPGSAADVEASVNPKEEENISKAKSKESGEQDGGSDKREEEDLGDHSRAEEQEGQPGQEDEQVEWEEIGEVSATVAEGSELSDSDEDPRTMFDLDEQQHHLLESALGESEKEQDKTAIAANW